MLRRLAAVPALALILAACGDSGGSGSADTAADTAANSGADSGAAPAQSGAVDGGNPSAGAFAVTEGWVRNPPGGRDVTAGFFTLRNTGAPARLVAASSAEAERVEIHTMEMDGEVMRMREVEAMDVPENGALSLQSGGDHLMIFGLAPEAAADGALALTLTFEDGRTVDAALPFANTAPGQ